MEMLSHVLTCLPVCVFMMARGTSHVHAHQLTLSGCVKGSGCSQCPARYFTQASDGSMLCCPKCSSAALYHGDFPSSWCVCYSSISTGNDIEARTVRFPGPSSLKRITSSSSSGIDSVDTRQALHTGDFLKDALFVINQGGHVGTSSSSPGVSPAVQQALTLMAETLEDLHSRVLRLEDIVLRRPVDQQPSGSVDRVGTSSGPPHSLSGSCPATNFTRVGDVCYYVSVWGDSRSLWNDAKESCELMGAKLAEPVTRREFLDLTQYLSLAASTTGFSYWIGGLYPGLSWLWVYSGEEVTKSNSYWTGVDSSGKKVPPGDTISGRCLTLTYLVTASSYYFAPDQCGYEKYYVCEHLDRTHRRS